MPSHDEKVAAVVRAVLDRPSDKKISIRKATPSHQIHNTNWKDSAHRVDVSQLTDILAFSEQTDRLGEVVPVAVCEGQVSMGQLVTAAMERGLIPKVVPEYNNFTVAGLINGEGIQSSGFKHGLFTQNVLAIEVVLGNGEVRLTGFDADPTLYSNIIESYGSLAIVTKAVIALRPCKAFVRSTYTHYKAVAPFAAAIDEKTRNAQGDFLEGIVIGEASYLIIESHFTDKTDGLNVPTPGPQNDDGQQYYYQYLQQNVVTRSSMLWGTSQSKLSVREDAIPTYDFVFRSMRGAWWLMECHINLPFFTNMSWVRALIDKKTTEETNKAGGWVRHDTGLSLEENQQCMVLQDMGIHLNRLEAGIRWSQKRLGVYPLWVLPVHASHMDRLHHHKSGADLKDPENNYFCDIGIYGEPSVSGFRHKRDLKALADFVDFPSTWGVSYSKKTDIAARYAAVRSKYHATDAFMGIEDKVTYRDAADDDIGKPPIFMWRLQRDYGKTWPIKVTMFFAVLFAIVGLLSWACVAAIRLVL
jgi:hypothetical protein